MKKPPVNNVAPPSALGAFTLREFCERYRISVPMFYKLRAQGNGPVIMRVGNKVLISRASAERWRKQMEETAR